MELMQTVASDGSFAKGTLTSTTFVVGMSNAPMPANIWLNSTDVTRAIELSNDGTIFFTPPYDNTLTGQIAVTLTTNIASVRFTGVAGDKYGIR